MTRLSTLFIALMCFFTLHAVIPGYGDSCVEMRTPVYEGFDGVSNYYRIPALLTMPDGTLVTVADRRLESFTDLPSRIDVVCRTSQDGGYTWSDVSEVAVNDEGGGYGDPAIGYDPASGDLVCVMTHGNGIWQSTPDNHAYIYLSRSSDKGKTWSKPVDITAGLFSPVEGEAPVTAISAFATSGRMLTDSKGNMWFVLITRPGEFKWGPLSCYACKSTDGGRTWKALPACIDEDGDESKMIELADGSLMMSIRNRRKGYRKFAVTKDGGKTWTKPEYSTTLPDPACNGDIIWMADGTMLHSIPDSHNKRVAVSVYSSKDQGKTWSKLVEICPTGSAYSSITMVDDHTLGVLSEEDQSPQGFRLWFTRINLDKIPE